MKDVLMLGGLGTKEVHYEWYDLNVEAIIQHIKHVLRQSHSSIPQTALDSGLFGILQGMNDGPELPTEIVTNFTILVQPCELEMFPAGSDIRVLENLLPLVRPESSAETNLTDFCESCSELGSTSCDSPLMSGNGSSLGQLWRPSSCTNVNDPQLREGEFASEPRTEYQLISSLLRQISSIRLLLTGLIDVYPESVQQEKYLLTFSESLNHRRVYHVISPGEYSARSPKQRQHPFQVEEPSGKESSDQVCRLVARDIIRRDDFDKTRRLATYFSRMGDGLAQHIEQLGPEDHIFDAGSGESIAMAEYLNVIDYDTGHYDQTAPWMKSYSNILSRKPEQKACVSAISYAMNNKEVQHRLQGNARTNLIVGKFFEDVTTEDIIERFGRVSCLIDYYGVLAYTERVSCVLARYIDILRDDGVIFLKVRAYDGSLGLHLTKVITDSFEVDLPTWISLQPGLDAEYIADSTALKITITDRSRVAIGDSQLVDLKVDTPPQRVFGIGAWSSRKG